MDLWQHLPLGFKFDPTDGECISGYLVPRVQTGRDNWNLIGSSDEVYKKPPWEFCTGLTVFKANEKYYSFTKLKMTNQNQNQNRVARTVGSYGYWHESNCKRILEENNYINHNNNRIIGFNRLFNFKKRVGKETKITDWLMHEFSLPGKENLVLCVIQKKKKKGSANDTYPDPDPMSFIDLDSITSAGGDPCPASAPAPATALDSEEEETRPSKKMPSDPKIDDDPFPGGDPCSAPAPAPAPAPALDSEEEETRPSKKMRSDPKIDDDPFPGGDPCSAPAPAPALDSEEEETRPSKKMPSDPKLDDHPVSVASSSVDFTPDFLSQVAADLLEAPALPDDTFCLQDCVLLDDVFSLPNDVFGLSDL